MKITYILLALMLALPTLAFADNMVCTIRANNCNTGENNIFQLYALTNSHASNDNSYTNKVCCTNADNLCTNPGKAIPLKLSSIRNAHAEITGNSYTTNVCLGSRTSGQSIICSYGPSAPSTEYTCLASVSSNTNAHVGDCNAYNTKVWCRNITRDSTDTTPPSVSIKVRINGILSDPSSQWYNKTLDIIAQCSDDKGCVQTKLQVYTSNPPATCPEDPNQYTSASGLATAEYLNVNQNVTICAISLDTGLNTAVNDSYPFAEGNQPTEIKIDKIMPQITLERRMNTVATICRDNESGCNNDRKKIQVYSNSVTCPTDFSSYSTNSYYTSTATSIENKWFCGYGEDNAININYTVQAQKFKFGPCDYSGTCNPGEQPDTCPTDCPICVAGDQDSDGNACDRSLGENELNCPNDCRVTCNNNNICELGETNSCTLDNCPATCGNGVCEETPDTCPTDCNDNPTILNGIVNPNPMNSCQQITFSADITDQNGIIAAFVCTTPQCTNKVCSMVTTDGYHFECTVTDTCSIRNGDRFYINATDSRRGSSVSSITIGVTDFFADAIFEYPQLNFRTVLKTDTGLPNFTRSMPVNFTVYPIKKKSLEPNYVGTLCDNTCAVSYRINSSLTDTVASGTMQWQEFSKKFIASVSTTDTSLTCDQEYIIEATISNIPGFSSNVVVTDRFFLNCVPKVTVYPDESRSALGQLSKNAFSVTIWNPREQNDYEIRIDRRDDTADFNLDFVEFDCSSASIVPNTGSFSCDPLNKRQAIVRIPAAGYATLKVKQTSTPRAGTFPIKFVAVRQNVV